jgi:4-aminobutyrate--pyruvate transaminase
VAETSDSALKPNSPEARDVATVLHPYTNLAAHQSKGPMVITRGEGVRVFDDEGKAYIEGLSGLWCTALGFSEPRLVEAAKRALDTLPFYHLFGHKSTEPVIDLAEKLLSVAPGKMSKVFFANSGSEANDTAIKLIWYVNNARGRPEKKKIIARTKGYHGVTVATASLTALPANQRDFDLPIDRILHTTCPHHYRFAEEGETEEAFATRCAHDLDALIESQGPDTVAAFFAEPVMGAGGVVPPPKTYFEKVQAVLKKHDVLLVADEVICGFGRTANWWGSQTYGIEPDMVTCAKALSSAYLPISALMVSDEIHRDCVAESEKIGLFGHGYTYGGHPVPAAVALEAIKIYEERDIVGHVRHVGPVMQTRLTDLGAHPLIGEARGVGLIGALEMVADKASKRPFEPTAKVGPYLWDRLHEHGVITRVIGDTPAFAPPLIITEAELGQLFDGVEAALDDTLSWARREGLI